MTFDLKSESEVKEYLNNLGIEYRFGCYSEKNPEVCHLLGDFLEAIKKDFEKAAKVYKNNCDEFKFGKSCTKYGNYNILNKGIKNGNYKTAYEYYNKGCELGDPQSCFHQGMLLVSQNEEQGVPYDISKGMECLSKSCDGSKAMACFYLSAQYILQARKLTEQSPSADSNKVMQQAFKYALRACELGNPFSCANVSQMYAKGEGVEKNQELADKYKTKAKDMEKDINSTKSLEFEIGIPP
ncbi:cytochrome c oxidase assembly factor 7 homolog [Cylas formicarius]|uniref:cytochrome c oxidase assembly factor 7 homolog n=1 Tax=Cylas formicarius TaxID=197179 RepID=UPI0029583B62|nr:cytochrome c oxidase assembly factor 7 homolog [Cylas formicarius]